MENVSSSEEDSFYNFDDTPQDMKEPEHLRHIAISILAFLSISGTIGNALVLYVFSRQKQKLSSTIFILTLAGTDFVSSIVTMPFTIAMELLHFEVKYDSICKLYHLLTTTTIPFSAFVMVAIAVDRYLCIVHPFKHTMTIKRAKITVFLLAVLATAFGLILCMMYGVYQRTIYLPHKLDEMLRQNNFTYEATYTLNHTHQMAVGTSSGNELNETLENIFHPNGEIIHIFYDGKCHKNGLIFSPEFFNVFQKVYFSFFGQCAVIVIVLYAVIYRSVLTRRRRRFQLTYRCCGFFTKSSTVENDHEQTEFTILNNVMKDRSPTSANGSKKFKEESFKEASSQQAEDKGDKNGNSSASIADMDSLVRPSGVSRAKLEKLRMANIKTASMLSIVALTYIIAFMPAWLMALSVIDMNVIVFYLYFTYNVANPIIYAFLNQSFRNHLQALTRCSN